MDKSKLPKQTRKSDETPWSPTHERKKLKQRAGTVFDDSTHLPMSVKLPGKARSWAGGQEGEIAKDKATKENKSGWSFDRSNVIEGKKKGGKPVSKRFRHWLDTPKTKEEESEY